MKTLTTALLLVAGCIAAVWAQTAASDSQSGGPVITVSVPPGSYSSNQLVQMVTDPGYDLYYTFAESRETIFTRYRLPFTLSAAPGEERTYTLQVEARSGDTVAGKKEFYYVIDKRQPASPVPSYPAGTYTTPIKLTFTKDNTSTVTYSVNSDIDKYPTLWDGSTPIRLDGTAGKLTTYRLLLFAMDAAGNRSPLGSYDYAIDLRKPPTPSALRILSPAKGVFANRQLLVMDDTGFDWVRYTLNGEDPRNIGTLYKGPVPIDVTGKVKLRAVGKIAGQNAFLSSSVDFTVDETPLVGFGTKNGVYDRPVTIEFEQNNAFLYNLDDLSDASDYQPYSRPFTIDMATQSVKYVALRFASSSTLDSGGPVYRFFFVLDDRTPAAPIITLSAKPPVNKTTKVTIEGPSKAMIYYTTDGTTPDQSSKKYDGPFDLPLPEAIDAGSILVKALTYASNGRKSDIVSKLVTFDKVPPSVPEINYIGKSNTPGLVVGVKSDFGSTVHYELTINDTTPPAPTINSPVLTNLLHLTVPYGMETIFSLRFAATDEAGNISAPTVPFRLLLDRVPPPPPVIALTDKGIQITGQGTVYYTMTTDGSTPMDPGKDATKYTAPIPVASEDGVLTETRVRAVAVDSSGNISEISKTFSTSIDKRVPYLPTIEGVKDGGIYDAPVTLKTVDSDPTIQVRYQITTDGSEPKEPDLTAEQLPAELTLNGKAGAVVKYRLKLRPLLVNGQRWGDITALSFTIDRQPPAAPVPGGFDNNAVYNHGISITPPASTENSYFIAISTAAGKSIDPFGADGKPFKHPVFVDVAPGKEAAYRIGIGAEDNAGNQTVSKTTYTFTIDRDPPQAPSVTGLPPGGLSRLPVTLQLKSTDADTYYEISTDGLIPPVPSVNSKRVTGPLKLEGEDGKEVVYTLDLVAIDKAGNCSAPSIFRLTIDRALPAPPTPPSVSYPTVARPTLVLSWDNPPEVRYYYRVSEHAASQSDTYTQYDNPVSVPVSPGTHTYIVRYYSRDKAGNASDVQQQSINVFLPDTTKPATAGIKDGGIFNTRKILSRTPGEGDVRYEVTTDGSDPPFVTQFSPLMGQSLAFDAAAGETIHFALRTAVFDDKDRNVPSGQQLIHFTIDKTPPAPPQLVGKGRDLYFQNDTQLQLSSQEGDIYVSVNKSEYSKYTGAVSLHADPGSVVTYVVSAYTRDAAGNRSLETPQWTVHINKAIVYVSPSGDDLADGSRAHPYKTLRKALERVRSSERKVIYLATGNYSIAQPLTISSDVQINGGLDPSTWSRASVKDTSTVQPAEAFPSTQSLVQIAAGSVVLSNIALTDVGGPRLPSMVVVTGGSLLAQSSSFTSTSGTSASIVSVSNAGMSARDSSFVGKDAGPAIISGIGSTLSIEGTSISGDNSGQDLTAISLGGTSTLYLTDSTVTPEAGNRTKGIDARESKVELTGSTVTSGAGRVQATAVHLFDSDATVKATTIKGNDQAWISTAVNAEYSTLNMTGDLVEARSNRGSIGIRTDASTLTMDAVRLRGMSGQEFIYLFQSQRSQLHLTNNMVSTVASRDTIGMDLTGTSLRLINNTFVIGAGSDLTVGLQLTGAPQAAIVNNILDVTASKAAGSAIVVTSPANALQILANCISGWQTVFAGTGGQGTAANVTALNLLDKDAEAGPFSGNISESPAATFEGTQNGVFHLSAHSTCIDAGIDPAQVGESVTTDYDGQARPNTKTGRPPAYDIGADEYYK